MANNKKSAKQVLGSIRKEIGEVDVALDAITSTIANVNGGIDLLAPENIALKDKASTEKRNQGLELKLQGNDKKSSDTVQRTIEQEIENRYKRISYYSAGGMYKHLFLAKQNRYMAQEFPNLKKSLRLFMTDVCWGSYFSANETTNKPFVIRKDGVEIDDENLKNSIIEIINPAAAKKEDVNYRSFDDLDYEAATVSRMDGYSFIRLIPTKKVLTDLYVKYVLKKVKSKTITNNTSVLKASSVESLNLINDYLRDIGFESTIPDTTYNLALLPAHIMDAIPKVFLVDESISNDTRSICPKSKDGKSRMPDGFEEYEEYVYANESFDEFAYRMLTGKTSTIAVYKNSNEEKYKRHVYSLGAESHSLDEKTAHSIYNDYFLNDNTLFNVDELEIGLESISRRLNIFDTNLVMNLTYEEIYSLDTFTVSNKIKNNIGETIKYAVESSFNGTDVTKPRLNLLPAEQVIRNVLISDFKPVVSLESQVREQVDKFKGEFALEAEKLTEEKFGIENIGTEAAATFRNSLTPDKEKFIFNGKSSTSDNINTTYDSSVDKAFKIFEHIKGCSSVILDNRRVIPLMTGNKNTGVLYIEKTHAEIEHLIATRSVMSNPMGGTDTMSLFQLDEERKEDTIGRLIFTDTIKPVFERNVNTKFLRENADLMYTIKELLEENEISKNDRSFGAFSDMGYFNLSKVSYIPANELIMYTNGDGLGESVFEKAFVPANAFILARESYLSWVLVDGKGICFITYPKGLNDLNGSYGANPLANQLEDILMTRMSLKMSATDNLRLSKPVITLPVDEGGAADKIDVKDVQPPEFNIDLDTINRWEEEATGIVGYPASSFTDLNKSGSNPELARKIESMDASIVLDITYAQDKKIHSSNSLATKLLHYRGGKEYESYSIEWVPPRPSRSNNNIKKEIVTEKKEVLESYTDMFNMLFEGKDDWETVRPFFQNVLKDRLFPDDKFLSDADNIYTEAKLRLSTYLASIGEETK